MTYSRITNEPLRALGTLASLLIIPVASGCSSGLRCGTGTVEDHGACVVAPTDGPTGDASPTTDVPAPPDVVDAGGGNDVVMGDDVVTGSDGVTGADASMGSDVVATTDAGGHDAGGADGSLGAFARSNFDPSAVSTVSVPDVTVMPSGTGTCTLDTTSGGFACAPPGMPARHQLVILPGSGGTAPGGTGSSSPNGGAGSGGPLLNGGSVTATSASRMFAPAAPPGASASTRSRAC